MKPTKKKYTLMEIVEMVEKRKQCNCDLDKWEPEKSTGHSFVCRIHKIATEKFDHQIYQLCND